MALYAVGTMLSAGFNQSFAYQFSQTCRLIINVIVLVCAVISLARGYRPARFFLLAWIGFLISSYVLSLARLGILPTSFWTQHGIQIGAVLEAWLLSLALGDRFQIEQRRAFDEQVALRKSYARFVPEQFILLLNKTKITEVELGNAVQREMTVLFMDIRSFTSLSERMTPEQNFRFLNRILGGAGPLIREHNGFIDKYMGDAIMALFPEDTEDAIRLAIAMCKRLNSYNRRIARRSLEPIRIGIGINTGNLMLGTIGEPERMEGTVISDAVNLASRLEGLTKFYDCTILISEGAFSKLSDPMRYRYRVLDRVRVKGKKEAVSVFEILEGEPDEIRDLKVRTRPDFERGIFSYLNRDFREAITYFEIVLATHRDDRAAELYRERARYYAEHGTPPGWEAVETMDAK